ncbi:unnamed protein product [Boreogadus saida]
MFSCEVGVLPVPGGMNETPRFPALVLVLLKCFSLSWPPRDQLKGPSGVCTPSPERRCGVGRRSLRSQALLHHGQARAARLNV